MDEFEIAVWAAAYNGALNERFNYRGEEAAKKIYDRLLKLCEGWEIESQCSRMSVQNDIPGDGYRKYKPGDEIDITIHLRRINPAEVEWNKAQIEKYKSEVK